MQRIKLTFAILIVCLTLLPQFPTSASPRLERSTADRPDDVTGYQIHVMYVLPADGIDEELDTTGAIATSVASVQNWLSDQTGGQKFRMDTFEGALDITFWRLATNEENLASQGPFIREAIQEELIANGFNDPYKIYIVYYGGKSIDVCANGAWPPSLVGTVSAVYLKGTFTDPNIPPCGSNPLASDENSPGYIDFAFLHEIMHTLGMVPECAPNHTLGGHTSDDPRDLMYAGDQPWQPSILDTGRDDYYGHGNPDCLDLAKSVFMEPTAPDATIPPGWVAPGDDGAMPQPSQGVYESGLCSVDTGITATVTFSNASTQPVDLFWVDYACGEAYFATIQPGQSFIQSTFAGHPWHIRDSVTAELLAETMAVSGRPYTVTIE